MRENPVFSERKKIFLEKEVVERNKVEKRREAMGDLESGFPMRCGKVCGKGENVFSFLFSTSWFSFSTEEGGKDGDGSASLFSALEGKRILKELEKNWGINRCQAGETGRKSAPVMVKEYRSAPGADVGPHLPDGLGKGGIVL